MKFGVIMGCLLGILALGIVSTDYSGTALAQESFKAECPNCGEKAILRKGMGMIPLEKTMYCPDCKGKGAQHVCDECGAEVLACSKCKKVLAVTEGVVTGVCPTCGEKTRLRKGMGITALEKEMVCPDCKGKGAVHVCDRCGAEVVACPRCSKILTTKKAEVVKAVCPHCTVETTLRKGMGLIALQKAMKCPNCEKPIEGFEEHVCGECGARVAICPICKESL